MMKARFLMHMQMGKFPKKRRKAMYDIKIHYANYKLSLLLFFYYLKG